jgi:hypothetical protein
MYVVPWKLDLGDLVGRPVNSLDEVLQPVDRDVFKRENRYYDAQPDATVPSKTRRRVRALTPELSAAASRMKLGRSFWAYVIQFC